MRFDRTRFFASYRVEFGKLGQSEVNGIEQLLGFIEADDAWDDLRQVSYLLATIRHECANKWKPIREYASGEAYEGRKDLGNTQKGDGRRFAGRGYVQITGRRNYTRFSSIVERDLVSTPDIALEPGVSYHIAAVGMREGLFTGKSLGNYIQGAKCDYQNARRIINKLDKASLIAGYARKFESVLEHSVIDEEQSERAATLGVSDVQHSPIMPEDRTTEPPAEVAAPATQEVATGAAAVQVIQGEQAAPTVSSPLDQPIQIVKDNSGRLMNLLTGGSALGVVLGFIKDNAVLIGIFVATAVVLGLAIYFMNRYMKLVEARYAADRTKYNIEFVSPDKVTK